MLNILLLYLLANQLLQVPVFGYLASLRPSVPAECPPNGPLSGGIGKPPKARAKVAAAKADAKQRLPVRRNSASPAPWTKEASELQAPAEWRWSALGLVLKRR